MEKITARNNPVYNAPKPWEPQGRQQIEKPANDITKRKIFKQRPVYMPASQPLVKPGVKGYEMDFICNADFPMPINTPKGSRWQHVDAKEVDGASDDYAYYECPNCGHRFKCELPQ